MLRPFPATAHHRCTLLLLLTVTLLPSLAAAAAAHHHHLHDHAAGDGVVISQADYQGLQAIKHDLTDPYAFLRSWNDTGLGACSGAWVGIKCVQGKVVAITLPWRGLAGTLSERIGQLTQLRRLSLHDNAISGPIPTSLGFLPDLRGVYLFNNRFSGAVPASIGNCVALQAFDASNNLLTGAIPPSLANSTKLMRLNLSHNTISGDIPSELAASPSLVFLSLSHNKLSGHIPDTFAGSRAPSSSSLKESITGTYNLAVLELSHNSLDGQIPQSLAGLQKLQVMDLSGNRLNGTIPDRLGSLADLKTLDLSGNALTGEIPASLSNLTTTLQAFNVSNNNLSGQVPASLAQKFGPSAFAGNIQLCGYSVSVPCPASPSPAPSAPASPVQGVETTGRHRKFTTKELALIIAGIVVGILLLLALCCLLLCFLTKKRSGSGGKQTTSSKAAGGGAGGAAGGGRGEKPGSGAAEVESGGEVGGKLVHFDGPMAFTADDLLCATAEIMGKSTYGTVYKATLEDGSLVAVKRLREKITKGHKDFESEAAVLGKIRHPNLLPLRAYYLGPKGEKLLVLDFMPNGSLSQFLHEIEHYTPSENFGQRYMSSWSMQKIADFGLSRLMTTAANSNVLAAAGALGYRAPELSKLKKASAKTDVYSLGVIILELLTGKSPAETTNGMDLPQWVASIVKEEWTSEVFDLELMRDGDNGPAGDELVDTLKLALHCVDQSPSVRPDAREVLRQLEQIRPGPEGGAGPSDEGGAGHVAAASAGNE
ncbi:Os12g0107700 [Oryza sativa Japonica Group]|uniref:Os12g0107700 protein n=1 Tax=Oryza sativa subsp. japonica TaxID=39947 RepID=Q0IQP9_ORYSJ|nr:Os12g0107700 [Oryza sativa Japonica Group]|eukprot:NP_001065947.2 Os12g0107700 [Oryza sativa Japonica Group]